MGLLRRASLLLGAVCAIAAVGCGSPSFTTVDGGHNESGTAADTGTADGGPPATDAAVADAAAFSCDVTPHRLCDTFDSMYSLAGWWGSIPGCGAATIGSAEWVTPTHSLIGELVDDAGLNCAAVETTFMPSSGAAHCEFDVRYDDTPADQSPSDYFTLVASSPAANYYDVDLGLALGTSPPLFAAETFDDVDGGMTYLTTGLVGPMLPSGWHHVSFDLDPPNGRMVVSFDGAQQQIVTLQHLPPSINALTAQFGVTYNVSMTAMKVRLDDIFCDVP